MAARHMRSWNSFPENCKRSDRTGSAIIQSNGKMARTGRDQNSERTESRKIKVETTFDGTRVNPEKAAVLPRSVPKTLHLKISAMVF